MAEEPSHGPTESIRSRIESRGEEAIGKIAQDLLENQWVSSALTAALEARGKAAQAQELAMELLNLPSAAQLERLTRRVRSVSQRLESIEDAIARVEDGLRAGSPAIVTRLAAIEQRLGELTAGIAEAELRAGPVGPDSVSRDQERLRVEDAGAATDEGAVGSPFAPPAADG